MNRRELVAAVAAQTEQDPKAVDQTLRGFVDVVSATIKKGDPVVMSGFAKFVKVKRAARTARNPQTGEPVKVKASQKVRITPLKALKDVASGAAPAPKLSKAPAKKAATARRGRTAAAASADGSTATATATASKRASTKKATAKAPAKKAAARTTAAKATAKKATARKAAGTKATATKATTKRAATKRTPRT